MLVSAGQILLKPKTNIIGLEKITALLCSKANQRAASPIAAFHPKIGIINLGSEGETSNMEKNADSVLTQLEGIKQIEAEPEEELVPSEDQMIVNGPDGRYLMEKCK